MLCGLFFKWLFSALAFFLFFCFPFSTPFFFPLLFSTVWQGPRWPHGWVAGIASHVSGLLSRGWLITVEQWRPLDILCTHLPLSLMQLLKQFFLVCTVHWFALYCRHVSVNSLYNILKYTGQYWTAYHVLLPTPQVALIKKNYYNYIAVISKHTLASIFVFKSFISRSIVRHLALLTINSLCIILEKKGKIRKRYSRPV